MSGRVHADQGACSGPQTNLGTAVGRTQGVAIPGDGLAGDSRVELACI